MWWGVRPGPSPREVTGRYSRTTRSEARTAKTLKDEHQVHDAKSEHQVNDEPRNVVVDRHRRSPWSAVRHTDTLKIDNYVQNAITEIRGEGKL